MNQNIVYRTIASAVVLMPLFVGGCALSPPPPPIAVPPAIPGALPPIASAAAPMTLPRFLGLDVVGHGVIAGVRHVRLKIAQRLPALQPVAKQPLTAVGDPANVASPSPAVASAAAIQQAEASAPAKIQALGFLASVDCRVHPQAEAAFLAGMDDCNENVRAAAVQALIDSQQASSRPMRTCRRCGQGAACNNGCCGHCSTGCTQPAGCCTNGCCTDAIRARLTKLAYEQTGPKCYYEVSPRVRRLARIALQACGGPAPEIVEPQPEELPPPAVLEMLNVVPAP